MLDNLTSIPIVKSFLSKYPRSEWWRCIEMTIIQGISSLSSEFPDGLSLEDLLRLHETRAPRKQSRKNKKKREEPKTTLRSLKKVESRIGQDVKKDIEKYKNRATRQHGTKENRRPYLKIPCSVQEPSLCSIESACSQLIKVSASTSSIPKQSDALKIADSFLKNPFTCNLISPKK